MNTNEKKTSYESPESIALELHTEQVIMQTSNSQIHEDEGI